MEEIRPTIFWICNPNNPTGTYIAKDKMELIEAAAIKTGTIVVVDEGCRFPDDGVCDVFIHPEGFLATGHPADTPDAIDDGHVVAMGVLLLEELGVFPSGWPVPDALFVIHLNWIGRFAPDNIPVLNPHRGDAVDGCRNQVGLIKAECIRTWRDVFVPIQWRCRISKPKVPFADKGSVVAGLLQSLGERALVRQHSRNIIAMGALLHAIPKRIPAS